MLRQGSSDGFQQFRFLAGLGKKTKDVALVDGVGGGAKLAVPGEYEPYGVGSGLAYASQKLDSVHLGHGNVGDDHAEGPVVADRSQACFTADSSFNLEHSAKQSLIP